MKIEQLMALFVHAAFTSILIVSSRSESIPGGANQLEIPMVPSGVYVGMSIEDFEELRPSAVRMGGFLVRASDTRAEDNRTVTFLESERRDSFVRAIVYSFQDGYFSSIAIEENHPRGDFEKETDKVLNMLFDKFGDCGHTMLLKQKMPVGRHKQDISTRSRPSMMWEADGIRILLTMTSDEVVQNEGVGSFSLWVLDSGSIEAFDLSPVIDSSEDDRFSAMDRIRRIRKEN